jgi:hypothetical protein
MAHGRAKRHRTTTARGNSVKSLIERRLTSIVDQPGAKVFLQGLMGAGGTLAQDPMDVFWNVFDLHTRHSAIVAPLARHDASESCADGTERDYPAGSFNTRLFPESAT